jgi:hydroxymethylpyrimidine pyrophosphatase-like HAD family hydrolase
MKRAFVIATDYDGTLARDGRVDSAATGALEALRASGRRVVLVTGRVVPDLLRVFPRVELFDSVVAENGAVLFDPASGTERPLADPPRPAFTRALLARDIAPLTCGRVIVATLRVHEAIVRQAIAEHGRDLAAIYNEESLMVLPRGVDKGSGVRAAFEAMGLDAEAIAKRTVAIGDAENDVSLLEACALGIAVADAHPDLRRVAQFVTRGAAGWGFVELVQAITSGANGRSDTPCTPR